MKTIQLIFLTILLSQTCHLAKAQMAVNDVGAGIQREALWTQEKGILSKMNWYNLLIKALNGDIKGLTGELLGIDQELLDAVENVSGLIKDYKRIQETRQMLSKILDIYTEKVPLLIQDHNFTPQQAAAILQAFDIILTDSRDLVTEVLNTITIDKAFLMDDKARYDVINGIYRQVHRHYGTICYLYNKILYASYMKSCQLGDLKTFAFYYSLYETN
jgi:GTPase